MQRPPWWCWPLLAAAVCAVSSAGVAFTFMRDVPALTLAAWRLQLTAVLTAIAGAVQWRGLSVDLRARCMSDWRLTVVSGVTLAVHFALWVASLQLTSLAHSLLLVSTSPIMIVAVAAVRREPLSSGEVAGAVAALGGCGLLAAGAAVTHEAAVSLAGDAAALGAAAAIVGHWRAGKALREYQPVFVYSAPVTAIAAVALSAASLATGAGFIGTDARGTIGWLTSRHYAPLVAYLACVPGIVGHQGFNAVLRFLTPLHVSLAVQLEPVLGALFGWLARVAPPPGIFTWAGGSVVLAATAGATIATARREAAATAAADAAATTQRGGSGGRHARRHPGDKTGGRSGGSADEELWTLCSDTGGSSCGGGDGSRQGAAAAPAGSSHAANHTSVLRASSEQTTLLAAEAALCAGDCEVALTATHALHREHGGGQRGALAPASPRVALP